MVTPEFQTSKAHLKIFSLSMVEVSPTARKKNNLIEKNSKYNFQLSCIRLQKRRSKSVECIYPNSMQVMAFGFSHNFSKKPDFFMFLGMSFFTQQIKSRCSHPVVFWIVILKSFPGIRRCESYFFSEIADRRPATLLKRIYRVECLKKFVDI